MAEHDQTVVTGGTGVLGREVLAHLTPGSTTCLLHRNHDIPEGFEGVDADLLQPKLGLRQGMYEKLCKRTTRILHCAATTSFAARPDVLREVNEEATKRVLEFAVKANAQLFHVSTAFVERIDAVDQALDAADEPDIAVGISGYLHSKGAAERLVEESGIPATVIRPSLIMGRADSGAISRFQGLHLVTALLLNGKIAVLPVQPANLVDFLPCDLAGLVVAKILEEPNPRSLYWVTAGKSALTLRQLLDVTIDFAKETGKRVEIPRFVPEDLIDRLVRPVFFEHLSRPDRRRFEFLLVLLALFEAREPFPMDTSTLVPEIDLNLEDAHLAGLGYWAKRNGLVGETARP